MRSKKLNTFNTCNNKCIVIAPECFSLLPRGQLSETEFLTDVEILETAKVLLGAHGDNAWFEAAQRADHAYEDGNLKAFANWQRILRSIEALQNVHIGKSAAKH